MRQVPDVVKWTRTVHESDGYFRTGGNPLDTSGGFMTSGTTLRAMALIGILAVGAAAAACGGSSIEGTYGDPNGSNKIELKSGGKATFTFMNQAADCTYTTDKKTVKLDCKQGEPIEFTLSDDGTTLINPPGSMMPNFKKTK
jgi:hypothetical protein